MAVEMPAGCYDATSLIALGVYFTRARGRFLLRLHCSESTHTVGSINRETHMDQPTTNQPKRSALNTMRAKGWALCLLGLALLSSPLLLGQSPALAAYANALRPAGWFAFAAGAVLLGLHHISNARRANVKASPILQSPPDPMATLTPPEPSAPVGAPTLREIRDELKKKAGTPE